MKRKVRVGVLFGGKSAEHEVSLLSAQNVINALDPEKYDVVPIGIDKSGVWHLNERSRFLLNAGDAKRVSLAKSEDPVALVPGRESDPLVHLEKKAGSAVDVIFPVLHGPMGEDGTVQGLLKLAGIPYVGADVLGSAVGMDKDVAKRLMRDAGIPTAAFFTFGRRDLATLDLPALEKNLGLPCFVKPANLGSSVGISKVKTREELRSAIEAALEYDNKVLVEESIVGREIECSVLGNEDPIASVPGEIIPTHEFYSYEAKYLDENGARLKIPADLPAPVVEDVQRLAVRTFKTLCCEGMARVDFFLRGDRELFVNEINTIPGFTRISMYPKMFEASGIGYAELLDRLIQLALDRHSRDKKLKTSYKP